MIIKGLKVDCHVAFGSSQWRCLLFNSTKLDFSKNDDKNLYLFFKKYIILYFFIISILYIFCAVQKITFYKIIIYMVNIFRSKNRHKKFLYLWTLFCFINYYFIFIVELSFDTKRRIFWFVTRFRLPSEWRWRPKFKLLIRIIANLSELGGFRHSRFLRSKKEGSLMFIMA